jgi:hypothetical protein
MLITGGDMLGCQSVVESIKVKSRILLEVRPPVRSAHETAQRSITGSFIRV